MYVYRANSEISERSSRPETSPPCFTLGFNNPPLTGIAVETPAFLLIETRFVQGETGFLCAPSAVRAFSNADRAINALRGRRPRQDDLALDSSFGGSGSIPSLRHIRS